MKNTISFSLVILTLLGLAACTQPPTDKTKMVAPRTPGEIPGQKPTDPTGASVTDRFLARALHGHRTSHEIFAEVWMHIWEDRMSRPNSLFLDLQQFLQAHQDTKTNHFNLKNSQCPESQTQILPKFKDVSKTELVSIQFLKADCSDLKNPNWQEVAVATALGKSGVRWDIHNQFFPRGAGKHLAGSGNRSKCTLEHLDDKRLQSLHCEFLGQSRDNESYLLFSKIDFDRKSDNLIIAEGKKYKNGQEACGNPKYCTVIKVPVEGEIEIVETLGEGREVKAAEMVFENQKPSANPTGNPVVNLKPIQPASNDLNALGQIIKPVDEGQIEQQVDQQF